MLLDDNVVAQRETKTRSFAGGLVVKKGLNIFSITSGGMPLPLSRILIATRRRANRARDLLRSNVCPCIARSSARIAR